MGEKRAKGRTDSGPKSEKSDECTLDCVACNVNDGRCPLRSDGDHSLRLTPNSITKHITNRIGKFTFRIQVNMYAVRQKNNHSPQVSEQLLPK